MNFAISIGYSKHNNIPVEECMPHDVELKGNVFLIGEGMKYEKCSLGKMKNTVIDGKLVAETKTPHGAQSPMPHLVPIDVEGKLGISRRKSASEAAGEDEGHEDNPEQVRQTRSTCR